jgi:hypothetical protein
MMNLDWHVLAFGVGRRSKLFRRLIDDDDSHLFGFVVRVCDFVICICVNLLDIYIFIGIIGFDLLVFGVFWNCWFLYFPVALKSVLRGALRKIREGAPLASYSIDRRYLRKYAEATSGDQIEAFMSFL